MALLKADNITMQFGGVTAVKDFNLELNSGEIISLIGPNGAGKTTAFNVITGVYKPTKGSVSYAGKDLSKLTPDKITALKIARTFQNIRLFKDLSVLENVLIANHLNIKSNFLSATLKLPSYKKEEKEMYEKSIELLKKVDLLDLKDEKASSLPYGKQRKLEIARALATKPEVLLLDEPAAGMNPKETLDLMNFVQEIKGEFNLSILIIEHHMQMVMGLSHKIYVLEYGITIAQGTPKEIQNNSKVVEAYLGVEEDA